MASIRDFKKEIDASMQEFYADCRLFIFAKGEEAYESVVDLYNETGDKVLEVYSRLKAYDKGAGKKAVKAHFRSLREEIQQILSQQSARLSELLAN